MGSPRITYATRTDATPQAELGALASVYRFALDCREKRAAAENRPDDAKG